MQEEPKKQAARANVSITTKESKRATKNVLLLDVTIDNQSTFAAKDFEVECSVYGGSGTELQYLKRMIYESVKSKEKKTAKDINFGLSHNQSARYGCTLLDFALEK